MEKIKKIIGKNTSVAKTVSGLIVFNLLVFLIWQTRYLQNITPHLLAIFIMIFFTFTIFIQFKIETKIEKFQELLPEYWAKKATDYPALTGMPIDSIRKIMPRLEYYTNLKKKEKELSAKIKSYEYGYLRLARLKNELEILSGEIRANPFFRI